MHDIVYIFKYYQQDVAELPYVEDPSVVGVTMLMHYYDKYENKKRIITYSDTFVGYVSLKNLIIHIFEELKSGAY